MEPQANNNLAPQTPFTTPPVPSKNNISLIIILSILLLGFFGSTTYLAYQNNLLKQGVVLLQQQINEFISAPTSPLIPDPTKTENVEIIWVDYLDSARGVSFKHPDGWETIYALSRGNMEIDIRHPEKSAFVFVSIRLDERIGNELSIEDAISEKENEIKSNESYKILDFRSLVESDTGSYAALGEEQWFMFDEERELGEPVFATYKFQEKGLYKIGEKTIILHGTTSPGNQNENIITQIIESFEFKNDSP